MFIFQCLEKKINQKKNSKKFGSTEFLAIFVFVKR